MRIDTEEEGLPRVLCGGNAKSLSVCEQEAAEKFPRRHSYQTHTQVC